ncbi:hypothetical protein BDY19DRAFT_188690 [Irpex rosettiformis]|uniref:Uncharacterized protein n=1 Tax=Irpex rosettiformis TaxID=378272 RepID=A0ACB8U225_9APHY|nr:hypothetical protein BDY19DRAFT_188690 [Irpex rosettiformis]
MRVVLEDSRDTASDMSARMKTFYQTLVPLAQKNDLPQETKLQIIGKFIIACEISENEAKSTAKRFTDILDRVNIFEKSFGEFASADMTAKEKEIKEINEKITKLNDQIDKLKTEGIVEAVGFGAAIITICVLAVCMAPVGLALAALGGGVIAAGIGANTFEQLRGTHSESPAFVSSPRAHAFNKQSQRANSLFSARSLKTFKQTRIVFAIRVNSSTKSARQVS